jgi:hypothetical protein
MPSKFVKGLVHAAASLRVRLRAYGAYRSIYMYARVL